ncbi:MAG: glycosyltransferase family 9 protein [Candidatus Margulisbacteria bacterium]|nr:glycosyltransferase family 9 protein [Candidatus Margulisiibacteriota bacterium]
MLKWLDQNFLKWFVRIWPKDREHRQLNFKLNRILLIRLGAIGDTILLLPSLEAILKAYPQARIDILAWDVNAEVYKLLGDYPRLKLIRFSSYRGMKPLLKLMNFAREHRSEYDAVIDLEQFSYFTAFLSKMFAKAFTFGFDVPGTNRKNLYDHSVFYDLNRHESLNFFALINEVFPAAVFKLPERRQTKPDKILGIHPLSKWPQKIWPQEKFVELVKVLKKQYPAFRIKIYLPENEPSDFFREQLADKAELITGKTIPQLAYDLESLSLLIANDNGIMHLAGYTGIPVIGIFGMSDPNQWHAFHNLENVVKIDIECAPCNKLGRMKACKNYRCINEISVDRVLAQAKKLLG